MTVLLENANNSIALRSGMKFGQLPLEKFDSGNFGIKGLNVFRAGTFKDSMGIQRTWEKTHLEQMVFHFNLLRNEGKFVDVPFREDHTSSVRQVVGYFSDLRHEDGFLVADIEFVSQEAADSYKVGKYRARSAEVGFYETNDEVLYWPVLLGTAFVDIGAVEGLYSKPRPNEDTKRHFFQVLQDDEKEPQVAEDANNPNPATPPAGATTPPTPPAPSTPPAPPTAPSEPPAQPAQHAAPAQPAAPAAPVVGSHSFTINGEVTNDFGAVQRHVEALELFRTETVKANRLAFVSKLASDNKILASQVDGMNEFVSSMDDAQFSAMTKLYESTFAQPLLANHGAPTTGNAPGGAPGSTAQTVSDEIEVLEETVSMHKRSGMSQEQLEKTDSYRKLQQLKSGANAA